MSPADYAVLIAKALNTDVEFLVTGKSSKSVDSIVQKENFLFSRLQKEDQLFFIRLMDALQKK